MESPNLILLGLHFNIKPKFGQEELKKLCENGIAVNIDCWTHKGIARNASQCIYSMLVKLHNCPEI